MSVWIRWSVSTTAWAIGLLLTASLWAQTPSLAPTRAAGQPAVAGTKPLDRAVLIVSVDGMRADLALRANMPNLRQLLAQGSFTFWARTTNQAVTLPSHVSMMTGVTVEKHKISWNSDAGNKSAEQDGKLAEPAFPTLFQLAKRAGYSTAMVSGKSKFSVLQAGNAIDQAQYPKAEAAGIDAACADAAIAMIKAQRPQVLLLHFPGPDSSGHSKGWGSEEQIKNFEAVDAALGRVLVELDQQKLREKTLVIVNADHGGTGRSHGGVDPRSRHIPWIIVGPGIRANYDMTLDTKLDVRVEDTFATACDWLQIPAPQEIDGQSRLAAVAIPKPKPSPQNQPAKN